MMPPTTTMPMSDAEHERGEDPAVELEVAQLARDDRHDRRDRERLERDEGDREDEPDGQVPAPGRPQAQAVIHGSRGALAGASGLWLTDMVQVCHRRAAVRRDAARATMERVIRTERLLMRRWRDDDRGPFAALNADPAVMEHMTGTPTRDRVRRVRRPASRPAGMSAAWACGRSRSRGSRPSSGTSGCGPPTTWPAPARSRSGGASRGRTGATGTPPRPPARPCASASSRSASTRSSRSPSRRTCGRGG